MGDKKLLKKKRILHILLGTALLVLLAGTIMMFFDYTKVEEYSASKGWHIEYYDTPESGILPLLSFVILFIDFILTVKANLNKRKLLIGSMVLLTISSVLIYTNTIMVSFIGEVGFGGYIISLIVASFIDIVFVPMTIYIFVKYTIAANTPYIPPKTNTQQVKKEAEVKQDEKPQGLTEEDISKLKHLKELVDLGVLSEEEFQEQKKIIVENSIK